MLMLPPSVRIYLATAPVDCRKSFDGLAALVRHVFGQDPLCGHIFVFRNRRGDHLRALVWDRSGFVLLCKRLERGVFRWPEAPSAGSAEVTVDPAQLAMMLDGVDLTSVRRSPRWPP